MRFLTDFITTGHAGRGRTPWFRSSSVSRSLRSFSSVRNFQILHLSSRSLSLISLEQFWTFFHWNIIFYLYPVNGHFLVDFRFRIPLTIIINCWGLDIFGNIVGRYILTVYKYGELNIMKNAPFYESKKPSKTSFKIQPLNALEIGQIVIMRGR